MFVLFLMVTSIISGLLAELICRGWSEKIWNKGNPSLFWSCFAWPYLIVYTFFRALKDKKNVS